MSILESIQSAQLSLGVRCNYHAELLNILDKVVEDPDNERYMKLFGNVLGFFTISGLNPTPQE